MFNIPMMKTEVKKIQCPLIVIFFMFERNLDLLVISIKKGFKVYYRNDVSEDIIYNLVSENECRDTVQSFNSE